MCTNNIAKTRCFLFLLVSVAVRTKSLEPPMCCPACSDMRKPRPKVHFNHFIQPFVGERAWKADNMVHEIGIEVDQYPCLFHRPPAPTASCGHALQLVQLASCSQIRQLPARRAQISEACPSFSCIHAAGSGNGSYSMRHISLRVRRWPGQSWCSAAKTRSWAWDVQLVLSLHSQDS